MKLIAFVIWGKIDGSEQDHFKRDPIQYLWSHTLMVTSFQLDPL